MAKATVKVVKTSVKAKVRTKPKSTTKSAKGNHNRCPSCGRFV